MKLHLKNGKTIKRVSQEIVKDIIRMKTETTNDFLVTKHVISGRISFAIDITEVIAVS